MRGLMVLAVLVAGCHGDSKSSADLGVDMTATIKSGAPTLHRSSAAACTTPSPPGGCTNGPDLGIGNECHSDVDCTGGRCYGTRFGDCSCIAADCSSDSDCASDHVCGCQAPYGPGGIVTNRCLPSNCHTDADCGAGQYCAPSVDEQCGYFFGVTLYACTTPRDTCRTDEDCGGHGMYGQPFCAYFPEVDKWACSSEQCAG